MVPAVRWIFEGMGRFHDAYGAEVKSAAWTVIKAIARDSAIRSAVHDFVSGRTDAKHFAAVTVNEIPSIVLRALPEVDPAIIAKVLSVAVELHK
jgi:hypothetical protein